MVSPEDVELQGGRNGHPPTTGAPCATPAPPRKSVQKELDWCADQLNTIAWTKLDVDTLHTHAHAAIVARPTWHGAEFPVRDHLERMIELGRW